MIIRWDVVGKMHGRNLYSGSISNLYLDRAPEDPNDGVMVARIAWNGKLWELTFIGDLGLPTKKPYAVEEYRNDLMETADGVVKIWRSMRNKPYSYSEAAQKLLKELHDTGVLSEAFKDHLITLFNKAMGDAYDHGKATAELDAEQGH